MAGFTQAQFDAIIAEIKKVDEQAVDGLAGISNSLGYKVHEIEKHLHNREYWFGQATTPVQGVTAGEKGICTPFIATSIATGDGFGAWIPVLGNTDTPSVTGSGTAYFDAHRMEITDVDVGDKLPHFIQFGWSTLAATSADADAGADALANGDISGFITVPEKDGKSAPIDLMMPRIPIGTRLLMRYKVCNRNTPFALVAGTGLHFFVGLHEYAG